MAAKKTGKKKIKTLPTRALSAKKAKAVKGGLDGIKGESSDDKHKDWVAIARR